MVEKPNPDYYPLDTKTVVTYSQNSNDLGEIFQQGEELEAAEVGDGNLNLVFKVWAKADPNRTIVLKQALPYVRLVGDSWPLPTDRARIEAETLRIHYKLVPEHTPKVYFFDPVMYVTAMENLKDHVIMRYGLSDGIKYPNFAKAIGVFMARTLGATSDLMLDYKTKKEEVARFINPELCKITEDLVFTEPYRETERNIFHEELRPQVEALQARDDLRTEVAQMKEKFMTQAQALVHGDLHTGSVMVNQTETYVIDPEFAFYGPMAFDIGAVIANLFLNYAAQEGRMKDPDQRADFQKYLTDAVIELWKVFEAEFESFVWSQVDPINMPKGYQENYMLRLLQDSAGFAACKMMRRVIGLAGVADIRAIEDVTDKSIAASLALNIAQELIMNRHDITQIEQFVEIAQAQKPTYPWEG